MKKAIICRSQRCLSKTCRPEAGMTMVLVAVCMVAIIAMAALSIDVVTLYLARMEAQRSADAGALAAARVISLSGITGDTLSDTASWQKICGAAGIATQAAQAAASQVVDNVVPTVTVSYSAQGAATGVPDCSTAVTQAFATNPTAIVQVTRSGLPTLFSRMWNRSANSVSATAMAEAFNPSNSGSVASGGEVIPVAPRCVKPWVVPNQDPLHNTSGVAGICTGGSGGNCAKIVNLADGSVVNPGISLNGSGTGGIIGETFWLSPDCRWGQSSCTLRISQPQANYNNGSGYMQGPPTYPNLVFAPGQVGTTVTAVPSCASSNEIQEAVGGCDSPQNYSCGLSPSNGGTNAVDLSTSPDSDNADAVSCLVHQSDTSTLGASSGQDYLSQDPLGSPGSYPFQIFAGSGNPVSALSGNAISDSTSIVSLPIYDQTSVPTLTPGTTTQVTFVGFLQVFINAADQFGNVNVTVLNVAGCGNNASTTLSVTGSSPVPVRLISQ
jgi:hypothetical protein